MKRSLTQILDFIRKHRYGKLSLALFVMALLALSALLVYRLSPHTTPIALSEVADAIAAGKVVSVEDSLDAGKLIIHYKDGSESTARRDSSTSFLEQMHLLGVSDSQLARLQYQITEPSTPPGQSVGSIVVTLAMLG